MAEVWCMGYYDNKFEIELYDINGDHLKAEEEKLYFIDLGKQAKWEKKWAVKFELWVLVGIPNLHVDCDGNFPEDHEKYKWDTHGKEGADQSILLRPSDIKK